MKKINATWLRLFSIGFMLVLSIFEPAFAADPFGDVEDKGEDLLDIATGNIGIIVVTLAIIIGGFGLLFNMINKQWAFRIIGGGILIGSAASIADWLVG